MRVAHVYLVSIGSCPPRRKDLNTIVYPLPPNNTDKVQPIDAGFDMSVKQFIGDNLNKWLEIDGNMDVWHDRMTAKERRILMTKWTGEAWDELKKKAEYIPRLFEKAGCLVTADSSDDEKIQPQKLNDYKF